MKVLNWCFTLAVAAVVAIGVVVFAEEGDASYWVNVLREMDAEARKAGREALIAMGAEAVPVLAEACADENDWIRWEAVNALGAIAHQDPGSAAAAIPAIAVVALTDGNPHPRWRSLYALACFPRDLGEAEVVPLLLAGLEDPDPHHQWYAAVALAYFAQDVAVPLLHEGLDRDDAYERWEAVYCLGFVHDAASVALLAGLVVDVEGQEVRIRQEAALVLGRVGDVAALPALVEALGDPEAAVRWRAASSLARLGDASILPALEAALAREVDAFAVEQIGSAIDQLRVEGS